MSPGVLLDRVTAEAKNQNPKNTPRPSSTDERLHEAFFVKAAVRAQARTAAVLFFRFVGPAVA